jgi:hypothetical protein
VIFRHNLSTKPILYYNKMKATIQTFLIVFFLLAFGTNCNVDNQVTGDSGLTGISLEDGFLNPPKEAKPAIYYLLLNGYANKEYFETELESLSKMGIGGLCVFDMGGRGNKDNLPSGGPAFMSDEWLDNFGILMEHADRLDMNIQLGVSSSWDMGGAWVTPDQASMALYNASKRVKGPGSMSIELPAPVLPDNIPKNEDGDPAFQKEIALLALPVDDGQSAWEFVFRLPSPGIHTLDQVVLHNMGNEGTDNASGETIYVKEFSVLVSTTGQSDSDFKEVIRQTLDPETGPQKFEIDPVEAKFVCLRIFNGYNDDPGKVQLGEFQAFTPEGRNVISLPKVGARRQDGSVLIRSNSRRSYQGIWGTSGIHDGRFAAAKDSWKSDGPPPAQVKDKNSIIDLSGHVTDGMIKWDVPDGNWDIIRYVCANTGELLKVPSPQSNGLATDHLNAEATRSYIKYLTDRLEERFGDLTKTPLNQLYLPSYEVRGQLWTPDLVELFNDYLNYDITPYLPALSGYVIGTREETDLFMYDFERTMGDLLVDAYYRESSKTANEAGLGIEAESGGPGPPVHQVPVDALKALGAIDEIRGEYWPWRPDRGQLWVVKETACAAHTYGKKRVHMESFTGFRHWQDGPFEIKSSADRAFCEGMNHVVWHTSTHQPPEAGSPGWVYGAGTHYTPNLIWYPKSKPFIDFLSRSSFLLQQGLFVADVCYYYGDQGSNFVPPKHIDPSLGYGFDYDVVNAEVILNRMSVKDNRITLPDGMSYEILVLPDRKDISLTVLENIESLIKSGATVVGPKPERTTGLTNAVADSKKVIELADKIWGECDGINVTENKYGKGRIIYGRDLKDILKEREIDPDFSVVDKNYESDIDFIHRKTGTSDIYFIRNKTMDQRMVNVRFRVSGKTPEIWDPETGKITRYHVYQNVPEGIEVPLAFDPMGSVFVIFQMEQDAEYIQKLSPGIKVTNLSEDNIEIITCKNGEYSFETSGGESINLVVEEVKEPVEIQGSWNVDFNSGRGTPQSTEFEKLYSWSEHRDPSIKYYSGSATYKKEISISDEWISEEIDVLLDLGKLWAVGEVIINGKSAGIVWKLPYKVNITDFINPGINQVEIEVVNTWSNRLVGDAITGEKYGKTNITYSGTIGTPWKNIPLNESGLLGPVKLVPVVKKTVKISD